jgi:hypothetical protein
MVRHLASFPGQPMSNTLGFLPVIRPAGSPSPAGAAILPVLVPLAVGSPMSLIADADGGLSVRPSSDVADEPGTLLAELKSRPSNGSDGWWLAARSRRLTVNGLLPFALTLLSPGDLLAFDEHWWMTVSEWKAQTQPAPAEMAEKPCPVCGMALNIAPVVQCPCGRFYHLENAEASDPAEVLNCFLAGPCRMCNRQPSLTPVLMPEPPAKLLGTPAGAGE